MVQLDLESAIKRAGRGVQDVLEFGQELWSRSDGNVRPMLHQIIRIYEAIRNNSMRIAIGDTTSGGKTATSIWIKGLLDQTHFAERGTKTKAMLFAPQQALGVASMEEGSAWAQGEINNYTSALKLPTQTVARLERENLSRVAEADIIGVNFEKLSLGDTESNRYMRAIVDLIPKIDLVIVDEAHNLKNVEAERTRQARELIEMTKHKRLIMLSASFIPNKLSDIGFMLYMHNPDRYRHYSANPFDYASDQFSIMNAINSGAWFTLTRQDLQTLFNLPELRFGVPELGVGNPHRFELRVEDALAYFEQWKKDTGTISKVTPLSLNLLRAEMSELERVCAEIKTHEPNAQIGIYSFYVEQFSEPMKQRLEKHFPGRVGIITGRESLRTRLETARSFRNGEIDVSVQSYSTVSESISLSTKERPVYVIFAEPAIVPANRDQGIGRYYRIGQEAPVTVIDVIPHSPLLNSLMEEEKARQEGTGIKFRITWHPGTVFEDKYHIRSEKEMVTARVFRGLDIEDLKEIAELSEGSQDHIAYPSLPQKPEDLGSSNKRFNEGIKLVRGLIGKPIEELVRSNSRKHLIDSYTSDEWEMTSSADTNTAIAQVIHTIEEKTDHALVNILDWGSGTACLARILRRPVHNLDAMVEMLEGGKQAAQKLGIYGEDIDDYFHAGNARAMPFKEGTFDLVSSSYAIQYNAQGYQHRRDIEEILKETNRVLRDNGYGILALPNQATTQDDINGFVYDLIPRYGFSVLYSGFITGHAVNDRTGRENKVFDGFYLIVFQKEQEKKELEGSDDTFIFPPYKKLGIGGYRETTLQRSCPFAYKQNTRPAETFKTEDRLSLTSVISKKLDDRMEDLKWH